MIYLDYAADTPASEEALEAFVTATRAFMANPNAAHALGYAAKEHIHQQTAHIAQLLGVQPEEIIYTSGATEANNLAIKGVLEEYKRYGKHVITTFMEHSSVTGPFSYMQALGYEVDYVRVLSDGTVDLQHLKELLRPDTILVSTAYVDSECGVVQPVSQIADLVHQMPHCFYHVDATQAVGKVPVDFEKIDLVTFTAHKFNGLHGIGVLIKKVAVHLSPLHHGGLSTTAFRSGTPSLALITSLDCALEAALKAQAERYQVIAKYNSWLREKLEGYPQVKMNSPQAASPYILNFSMMGVKANLFKEALAKKEIYIATKSACTSPNTPSRPVMAMTNDRKRAMSMLRLSLSHLTTMEELEQFMAEFNSCYHEFIK